MSFLLPRFRESVVMAWAFSRYVRGHELASMATSRALDLVAELQGESP